jgi:iron complex transport system permease protein
MSRTVWFGPGSARRLIALLMLAAVVFAAALLIGTSGITLHSAFAALGGAGDEAARSVMLDVRLPRLLAAFGVGGLLAVAGVLLQALFCNRLRTLRARRIGRRRRRCIARDDR